MPIETNIKLSRKRSANSSFERPHPKRHPVMLDTIEEAETTEELAEELDSAFDFMKTSWMDEKAKKQENLVQKLKTIREESTENEDQDVENKKVEDEDQDVENEKVEKQEHLVQKLKKIREESTEHEDQDVKSEKKCEKKVEEPTPKTDELREKPKNQ